MEAKWKRYYYRRTLNKVQERLRALQAEKRKVDQEIMKTTEELMRPVDKPCSVWEQVSDETDDTTVVEIDRKASLREQLELLHGRERFLEEAIEGGRFELDRIVGKASLEICSRYRPEMVSEIKQIISGVNTILKAVNKMDQMRSDLERRGVKSGYLPSAIFDISDAWNAYKTYIATAYPEIETQFE